MGGFSVPQVQFLFNNAPAVGGQLYVYQSGTTTAALIYVDAALTEEAANPLTLDSNGEALFYVGTSFNLRFDAFTADNQFIQSIDPVYVIPDLTNYSPGGASGGASGGAFINKLRNSSAIVQQRGPTGTALTSSTTTSVDGVLVTAFGANIGWGVVGPTDFLGSPYYLQFTGNTGNTGLKASFRIDALEAASIAGGNCTFSIYYQNATGVPVTPTLTTSYANAFNNFGAVTADLASTVLQSVPTGQNMYLSYTFPISALAYNGYQVDLNFPACISGTYAFIGWDLRLSSLAAGLTSTVLPREFVPASIEWQRSYRYLYGFGESIGIIGIAYAISTTAFGAFIPFKNKMRIPPTGITVTTLANLDLVTFGGATTPAITSINMQASEDALFLGGISSSLTAGVSYQFRVNTALAGNVIITGAEL